MGVFFSDPKDKITYNKEQVRKAEKKAVDAARAGNTDEERRLKDVALKARLDAISNSQLEDEANRR